VTLESKKRTIFIVYNASEFIQTISRLLVFSGKDIVLIGKPDSEVMTFAERLNKEGKAEAMVFMKDLQPKDLAEKVMEWSDKKMLSFDDLIVGFEMHKRVKEGGSVSDLNSEQIRHNLGMVDLVYNFLTRPSFVRKKRLALVADPMGQKNAEGKARYSLCKEFIWSFSKVLSKETTEYDMNFLGFAPDLDLYKIKDKDTSDLKYSIDYFMGHQMDVAEYLFLNLWERPFTLVRSMEEVEGLFSQPNN